MKLHELSSTPGSRADHYRKGRGLGSGNGKTAGKGHKGQNARSGGGVRLGFEGGQLPLYRALPKRGFKNVNHIQYAVVNVGDLESKFDANATISPAALITANLCLLEIIIALTSTGGGCCLSSPIGLTPVPLKSSSPNSL